MNSDRLLLLLCCLLVGLAVSDFAVKVREKQEKARTVNRIIDVAEVFVK